MQSKQKHRHVRLVFFRQVLNNCLESQAKKLTCELAENLKKQATRLQKCLAKNGTLQKALILQTKNKKLKLIKQKQAGN